MGRFVNKLELIKTIIKNDDIILVIQKGDRFDYECVCDSGMMANLYHRLLEFIPNWRRQFLQKHKVN